MNEEIKKFLEELLAKNGGVITANALDEILAKYGTGLADELTKKWEDRIGQVEEMFSQKDLNKPKGAFKNFADFVQSVKDYKTEENQNKLKALTTGVQGDFIIPVEYAGGLLDFNQGSNDFIGLCRKIYLTGNSYTESYFKSKNNTSANFYAGVVSYWVEEGNAPTASDMGFGKINYRLHDLALLIAATNDMIDDSPQAVGGLVNTAFTNRIGWDLEDVFLNGNGVAQPLGVLNSAAKITQAKKTSQSSATIVSENLTAMMNRLPKGSKRNAVWIYDPSAYTEVLNCKVGASDYPAFIPAGGMSATQSLDTILGRPAFESEFLGVSLGTEKDIILVDPTQYTFALKALAKGIESSAHLYFDSNQTAFRLVFRVDGQPTWDTYYTPATGSTYKSPIVTLATRT